MECQDARRMADEGGMDLALASHLEHCPACRQEAQFARRVAAAVAVLPQIRAPEGFAEGVMAAVRQRAVAVRQPRRSASLILRPWELAWLVLSGHVLLILLTFELRGWLGSRGLNSLLTILAGWANGLWTSGGTQLWSWTHGPSWPRPFGADNSSVLSQVSFGWWWGGAMFALALYLLLTWGRSDRSGTHREDVHVQAG